MKPIDYTVCCHAIALGIGALVKVVTQISVKLSAPGAPPPPPLDLGAVITELECVCTQLTAISTSSATVATDLAPGLKSIADAVANAPPTDLKPLVDVLEKLYKTIDVPIGVYRDMADRGLISPQLLQAISTGEFGAGAVSVIADFVKTALTWLLEHIGIKWTGAAFSISPMVNTIAHVIDIAVTDALTAGAAPLYPAIRGIVDAVVFTLLPTAPPVIGDVHVDPDLIISKTLSPALILNGVMLLASYFGWDVGETLREYVDLATEFIGLREVRELKVGALMRFGPMRVAEMNARRVYRQELPDASTLAALSARGIMDRNRYFQLAGLTGVPIELEPLTLEAAESGLPPFLMIRLSGTGLFSDADIADELTFRGIRPTSQHRFIAAAAFLRTQPERNKFLATVEHVYAAGLISDSNFIAALDSAAHNTDSHDLSLRTVQLEKQIALAKEYEAAYSHEFLNGLLDAPSYQSALEALGMQPPDVAARLFRDQTHLTVTQTLGAERAARAATRKTQAEARKAAIEGFRTGLIDSAALTVALNLAGLTPAQTAAEVGYQVLAQAGALRWIYGRHLSPQEATLLRQQVQDLTRQREIQMLTDAQYVSQLQALQIPPRVIQALRAGANAHISPKTNAILTPPTVP